jgi:hypothetical protein
MADHDVQFTIPARELKRAPIEFIVKRNKGAFGRLLISEGGLEWVPANKQYGIGVGWKDFDAWIRQRE